jgi:V/A-type H+-transporting ATPase subunit B
VGRSGSITTVPVMSMPDFEITHPIPDLTGFITEGQIVFSKEMHLNGIYPPIEILPSLSRLMKDGVGERRTRADHLKISNQVYIEYSKGKNARDLALIMGEETLTKEERSSLSFVNELENRFINQGINEHRTVEETLDLALEIIEGNKNV